jgi:F0F1-type ATP synthase assembly protein I
MPGWLLAVRVAGMGWYVALSIVLGVLGGLWLDNKLGTSPLLTLSGTLLGVVAAFYGMYKMVAPLLNITDRKCQGTEENGS